MLVNKILSATIICLLFLTGCGNNDKFDRSRFCELEGFDNLQYRDNILVNTDFICFDMDKNGKLVGQYYQNEDRNKFEYLLKERCPKCR